MRTIIYILGIIGYIMCIIKFIDCDFAEPFREEVFYGIGVFTPLGAIFGYF